MALQYSQLALPAGSLDIRLALTCAGCCSSGLHVPPCQRAELACLVLCSLLNILQSLTGGRCLQAVLPQGWPPPALAAAGAACMLHPARVPDTLLVFLVRRLLAHGLTM